MANTTRTRRPAKGRPAPNKAPQRRRKPVKKRGQPQQVPEVVYTPAPAMSRRKLLLRLLTVVAVVIALLFGMAVFFRVDVEKTTVSGNNKYTAWEILQASGIEDGEGLLSLSRIAACGKIITALPYVKDVRIGISLPDTVRIYVQELPVTYACQSETGTWWLLSSEGKLVEQIDATSASNYTVLRGFVLASAHQGGTAQALETSGGGTAPEGESTVITVTNAHRLSVALEILQALESCGSIGQVSNLDLSGTGEITMLYGSRFEILLGDDSRLPYKIRFMTQAIAQMAEYQSGVLDVSFRLREEAILTPFGTR